jgi:NAD(P)-dependent dehydrogenase (short-subunit alcohol dehydrogenase family)
MICRNQGKGARALQEIRDKTKNKNLELFIADLSSQKEIRSLARELKERYPNIDILINNAGGINPYRTLTVDGIETTFAVNHLAYFLLTHLLLDQLKASRFPHVTNLASEAERKVKSWKSKSMIEKLIRGEISL